MSERLAGPGGAPTEALERLYRRWAEGGAGLLITGNVMVDARAIGESGNVVVEDDRHAAGLRAWARAARSAGAEAWAQINHPGRQAPFFANREAVAPSDVPLRGLLRLAFGRPRELAAREIEEIVEKFAASAAALVGAGFSGVQIHAAHGYLVNQFLSPLTNLRTDRWGGDADGRRRFLLEVVRAVRAAVGPSVPIGVKLNSADFQRGGFTEEESMAVVQALEAEGVDLLEVSGGTYEAAVMFAESAPGASTRAREAFFLDYASKVRQRTAMPILLTGGLRTRAGMTDALASGVDVIGLARPLALEPDLPRRLLRGETEGARAVVLTTGSRNLDSAVQSGWYQTQIRRIARGDDPDAGLGRAAALARYLVPLGVRGAAAPQPG